VKAARALGLIGDLRLFPVLQAASIEADAHLSQIAFEALRRIARNSTSVPNELMAWENKKRRTYSHMSGAVAIRDGSRLSSFFLASALALASGLLSPVVSQAQRLPNQGLTDNVRPYLSAARAPGLPGSLGR